MIFSLPLCLYCCLWEHQLLPRGFVETTLSFVSFEKSFQWINALLPSPPIYQPVCIIWVLWCCSVWESSLFGLFWNLPKVPKQHPPTCQYLCDFSLWSSPVISPCDHLLAGEEERLVTAGSSCASAHGPARSQLSLKATDHAEPGSQQKLRYT